MKVHEVRWIYPYDGIRIVGIFSDIEQAVEIANNLYEADMARDKESHNRHRPDEDFEYTHGIGVYELEIDKIYKRFDDEPAQVFLRHEDVWMWHSDK
jgi:hypothetical protein